MKTKLSIMLFVLGVTLSTQADPVVHTVGAGARAQGLANNFVALSNDYSAAFWNPAGLAFAPVRELHFSLAGQRQDVTSHLATTETDSRRQRMRLGSAGLLRAVPTSQGGFAFAVGFMSPYQLDDLNDFAGKDIYLGDSMGGYAANVGAGDTLLYEKANHYSFGQLDLWPFSAGWQVAPDLGIGFTVALLTGSEYRTIEFASRKVAGSSFPRFEDVEIKLERQYLGYDARAGFMYRPSHAVSMGMRLEFPRYIRVQEAYSERSPLDSVEVYASEDGMLRSSWAGAAGVAVVLPFATISSDFSFRSPHPSADPQSELGDWRSGAGIGLEVPLNPFAALIRLGYSWQQLDLAPMLLEWKDTYDDSESGRETIREKHHISAGLAILPSSGISFELAYGYQFWEFSTSSPDWAQTVREEHARHQATVSVSMRY